MARWPEQTAGDTELDARTDVYALGCVLYEMLEGSTPFEGRTPQAILAKKVTGAVAEFSGDTLVPATVAAVVRKALGGDLKSRYATPTDFAEELETAITAEAIEEAAARRRRSRGLRTFGAVAGVALLGFGGLWLTRLPRGPIIERVALLPFEDERDDPTDDVFIDGMHEALILELGQAGVAVISSRSVMKYRSDETPVRDIALELNVDAVIVTAAFRDADSVGLRLSLVHGSTEVVLWNDSFGEETRSVIRLFRRVTAAVTAAIGLELTSEVAERLASAPPPVDPEAYEAYLNGMSHWYRLSPPDLDLAEQYCERALRIDPDCALAHKGMAVLWAGRQQFGLGTPAEAGPKVRAAVRKALDADSTSAEVQFALAGLRSWVEWD